MAERVTLIGNENIEVSVWERSHGVLVSFESGEGKSRTFLLSAQSADALRGKLAEAVQEVARAQISMALEDAREARATIELGAEITKQRIAERGERDAD